MSEYFDMQLKPRINRILEQSEEYYKLMDDSLQGRNFFVADVVDEYFTCWRRALTRWSYQNASVMRYNDLESFDARVIKSYVKSIYGINEFQLMKRILIKKISNII